MARTPAQAKALETKALAAASKSEGMRMLLEAEYTVAQIRDIFDVPYGFVYGVAKRGKFIAPTPRAAKPKAKAEKPAKVTKPAAKAPAKAAAKTATKPRVTRRVAAAKV
jgi:hypothetical protein